MLHHPVYDLLVVGGGINGVGIALDAAGRGLRVLLCEMNDLGSATSSNSSKLIHGGLRYLEYYHFRLVREALAEREVLLKKAPHIIQPLRFRLPHMPHLRPAWMIRVGLFLYDHLSRRTTLPASHAIRFNAHSPLAADLTHGFEYSDGWVDDARLVILNALAAQQHGTAIYPRTRCIAAKRHGDHWQVTLQNQRDLRIWQVRCRVLVNATGPWVNQLFTCALQRPSPQPVRLVKGSHILLPRLHDQPEAYILQHNDQRIVFVIPFEERFSLVGTTDEEYHGDPAEVSIADTEIDYLLALVNRYFKHQSTRDQIVGAFSGVRPLLDDLSNAAHAVSRDYHFELDAPPNEAVLLSVFGGKITTYRKLAEAALQRLRPFFPAMGPDWTQHAALPGGDFEHPDQLLLALRNAYPWLPEPLARRWVRSYGTLSHQLLDGADRLEALGRHFGAGLYQREVDYLIEQEWAQTLDDILWRRTKLRLQLSTEQQQQLGHYLRQRRAVRDTFPSDPAA